MHIDRRQTQHDYHDYKAYDKSQTIPWKEPGHKRDYYDYNPAHFIQRFLATLIDGAILFPWWYLSRYFDNIWIVIIAAWIYYGAFEASPLQATPGKRALNIHVTNFHLRRLTVFEAFFRRAVTVFSFFTLGLGFLMPLWTQHCQTLHDIMTGTLVLRGRPGETKNQTP